MALLELLLFSTSARANHNTTTSGGSANKSADQKITLKLWHIWAADSESSKAPFLKSVDNFKKAHPNITLDIDATENETYKTKIRTAVAANEAPDIFFYWGRRIHEEFCHGRNTTATK